MQTSQPMNHETSTDVGPALNAEEQKLTERIAADAAKRLEQSGGVRKRLPRSISICGFNW